MRKVIFRLLIIGILVLLISKGVTFVSSKLNDWGIGKSSNIKFNIEELSKNENYSGIGQEKVEGKDGYDTTFTTINNKVYKEYKQVGNASWKDNRYWGGTFEENGCGLAAIATLLSGYGMNYTPEDLRKIYIDFPDEHL